MRLIVRWLVNAISLLIVAHFVSGFEVRGFVSALIAAIVIGFVNSTLGLLLKLLTFPLTILTLGLLLILINTLMLTLAAAITPRFYVRDSTAARLAAMRFTHISSVFH